MQILLEGNDFDIKIYPNKKVIYYRLYNMTAFGLLYFDYDDELDLFRLYQDWETNPIPDKVLDLLSENGYVF